jgi:tungstate transport system substrate-binding protein
MPIKVWLLFWLATAAVAGCAAHSEPLRLATTTSVENSGLLQEILPAFQEATGIEVQVLPVGSGRALQLLRRGDADVALTHDPVAEATFLSEMPSATYRKTMFNDFVVVGPTPDDAAVRRASSATDAMHRVATSDALFVSRGDESGTHTRENQLWQKSGAKPPANRVLETGQGMAATLRVASERRAYTLTDRATFAQLSQMIRIS